MSGAAVSTARTGTATLLLVRHGATPWTHEGRLQGRTDIDLSAEGRAEAAALAPLVAAWRPASVISSPLRRAVHTAEVLRSGLTTDGAPPAIRVDEAWTEHGLGEWEGLTPDQIGSEHARWRSGELVPPGGELSAETRQRVRGALTTAAGEPGPVLVVTHGGTIRAALIEAVGLTPDRLEPVAAPSLTVLDVSSGGARLRRYNLMAQG